MNDEEPYVIRLEAREFARLAAFIQSSIGIKMPPHKLGLLELRLGSRVRALGLRSFEEYCERVFDSCDAACELSELVDAVTTNKTDFFREPEHFGHLVSLAVPDLARRYPELTQGGSLKVWSAGCSSGEEPYTIAMVLGEVAESHPGFDFGITATDLSSAMLRAAALAVYPAGRVETVPRHYVSKYLMRSRDRDSRLVRVVPRLRAKLTLGRVNLMEQYPFITPFDVIFCRNVLIYFERDVQIDILQRMADSLVDGGYLFVGHSETLHGMDLPLEQMAPTVYRREARS